MKQPYFPGTLLMDEFVLSEFEPFSSTTPTDFVPFESACVRPADTAAACQVPERMRQLETYRKFCSNSPRCVEFLKQSLFSPAL